MTSLHSYIGDIHFAALIVVFICKGGESCGFCVDTLQSKPLTR